MRPPHDRGFGGVRVDRPLINALVIQPHGRGFDGVRVGQLPVAVREAAVGQGVTVGRDARRGVALRPLDHGTDPREPRGTRRANS